MEAVWMKLRRWIPSGQLIVLKILLFTYFGATHSLIPYLVVHMQQLGISVNETAIIHAVLPIAMFIGPPVSGFLADKSGGFRILLFVSLILTGVLHTCLLWVPSVSPANQLDRVSMGCDTDNHSIELSFDVPKPSSCMDTQPTLIRLHNCLTHCPQPYGPSADDDLTLCPIHSAPSVCISQLKDGSFMASTTTMSIGNDTEQPFKVLNDRRGNWTCGQMVSNCSVTCDLPSDFGSFRNRACGDVSTTFWVYLGIRVVAAVFMSSCYVLLDGITLILIRDGGTDYGKQRVWPVVATAVFPPITGLLVDSLSSSQDKPNYSPTFYMHDALLLLTAVLSPLLSLKVKFSSDTNMKAVWRLVTTPRADALIVSLFVLGTMWGFVEVFLYLYLLELGSPKYLLGLTLTVGSAVGIPVLFFSEQLINKFGHVQIMFVAFIFYAVRYIGYTFIYNPWWCLIFEAMEIFTLHLLWVSVVKYSSQLAPQGLLATMQGAIGGTHYGVGRGSGSLIGGLLTGYFGYRSTFLYMGIASAIAGVIYLIVEKTLFRKPFRPDTDGQCDKAKDDIDVKQVSGSVKSSSCKSNGNNNKIAVSTISDRLEPTTEIRL